jgi:hypothetical protein
MDMENLTDQEKQALEKDIKKRLGFSVDISKFNISVDMIEGAIMGLLEKERSERKAKLRGIFVRGFLVKKKKVFRKTEAEKLRLRTYWFDENNKLQFDQEDRKLSSYTEVDLLSGGLISRIFVDILKAFYQDHPTKIKTLMDTSIIFQYEVVEDEPKLSVTITDGPNPQNVVDKVDFNTIF